MNKIQKTARQALITFKSRDPTALTANFEKLKALVSTLKASDINLDLPEKPVKRDSNVFGAPVSYINIFESKHFTLGVFILKNGVSIPLHDHPGMHGICKVLYGAVRVRSFDLASSSNGTGTDCHFYQDASRNLIKCYYAGDRIFDSASDPCHLTPSDGNCHSIHSHGGQAAFLDILAPPYVTGERDCSYYREYPNTTNNFEITNENESVRWLMEIPQPPDFYCDSLPYKGPLIELEE